MPQQDAEERVGRQAASEARARWERGRKTGTGGSPPRWTEGRVGPQAKEGETAPGQGWVRRGGPARDHPKPAVRQPRGGPRNGGLFRQGSVRSGARADRCVHFFADVTPECQSLCTRSSASRDAWDKPRLWTTGQPRPGTARLVMGPRPPRSRSAGTRPELPAFSAGGDSLPAQPSVPATAFLPAAAKTEWCDIYHLNQRARALPARGRVNRRAVAFRKFFLFQLPLCPQPAITPSRTTALCDSESDDSECFRQVESHGICPSETGFYH